MNTFAATSAATRVGSPAATHRGLPRQTFALPIAAAVLVFAVLLLAFQHVVRQGVEAGEARRAEAAKQTHELWQNAYAKPALTQQQGAQATLSGAVRTVSQSLR